MDKILPISVLIPTMNRPSSLKRTIASYMSGGYIPSQIIVVDQSQEETIRVNNEQIVSTYSCETNCCYLYQSMPSLTKARNYAALYAENEICIYSDDDVDIYPDTLKNIYDLMDNGKIALIAGIDDNTPCSKTNIGYILGTKSYFKRKIGHVTLSVLGRYPDAVKGIVNTEWAMGYFFVIRKSLLKKYNIKWDEKLTSYAYPEDLDFSYGYCKAAMQDSYKCVLADKVHVKHLASREYRIPSIKSTYMYVIHRRYLSYKHCMGWKSRVAMNWSDFWMIIKRFMKKENPMDMINAWIFYKRNITDIRNGNIELPV